MKVDCGPTPLSFTNVQNYGKVKEKNGGQDKKRIM
jgi:hypothetical protein